MKLDPVAVLDLGATKVAALCAAQDDAGQMRVLGVATVPSRGISRGMVTDAEDAAAAIDAAIRRLQQEVGRDLDRFVVALGGSHVEAHQAPGLKPIVPKGRHITHQDVLEVVNHSRSVLTPVDREQIQAIPREFKIDGKRGVLSPIGESGGTFEVMTYLVTAPKAQVQGIENAVQRSNRHVDHMVLSPLAAGVAVLTSEEMNGGAVVVDLGGGRTDIGIFVGGTIAYSASIPIGSERVALDVRDLINTSTEEADRLKVEFGSAVAEAVPEDEAVQVLQMGQTVARPMQRRVLCEIIEARMREIANLVGQHVAISGIPAGATRRYVLTGGGCLLAGADQLFERTIEGSQVRLGAPRGPKLGDNPGLSVAVGLAQFSLQCFDELAPANGQADWKERVRSVWSLLAGR